MLETRDEDGVRVIEMAHGKVNALDLELLEALTAAFHDAPEDVPVVLTGRGRSFCAGVDLQRIVDGGETYVRRFIPALTDAFLAVFEHPRPVVAGLNGHALAGGCVLAAACDVRLVNDGSAQLGVTELAVGVPFPTSAMEILRHAVGDAHASRLVYTGQRIYPAEAYRLGLVTHLLDAHAPVVETAVAQAAEMGRLRRPAYRLAKTQLQRDVLERIARRRPADDAEVTELWVAAEAMTSIRAYLAAQRAQSR